MRVARLSSVLVMVGLLVTSCGYVPFVGGDTVSYRPDRADTTRAPNCLAENIFTQLTGSGPWDPAITPAAPEPGYPPQFFEPAEVLLCERSLDEGNVETVDSVRLRGKLTPVLDAFSADSERYSPGISASCTYSGEVPVGLWLVEASGRAFRPAWPRTPCGLQQEPLYALRALEEVSRIVHSTGYDYDYGTSCTGTDQFANSAGEGVMDVEPSVLGPIDDVGFLKFCRYPASGDGQGTLLTLDREESVDMIGKIANAPAAQPCALDATRVASTQLFRADGSGGAGVLIELDGCSRAMGFGAARQVPAEVVDAVGIR